MMVKGIPNALTGGVILPSCSTVIVHFDSLRGITASLPAEARKLNHLDITFKIGKSTLADANKHRPEVIFEGIYRQLYCTYRHVFSSDSRNRKPPNE